MSSGNPNDAPKATVEAAIAELKRLGIDTSAIEARLQDASVSSIIVGKWPPDENDEQMVEGLIKTRSIMQETLDLVLAKSRNSSVALPLNARVKDVSMSLTRSMARAGIDLKGEEHESIVGRWPPD